jgi:hypothetical protein
MKSTTMSKTSETQQPSVYDELLKTGATTLKAPTREALDELVANIPNDVRYTVGAVGRKQDGSAYTIQIDTIKD